MRPYTRYRDTSGVRQIQSPTRTSIRRMVSLTLLGLCELQIPVVVAHEAGTSV